MDQLEFASTVGKGAQICRVLIWRRFKKVHRDLVMVAVVRMQQRGALISSESLELTWTELRKKAWGRNNKALPRAKKCATFTSGTTKTNGKRTTLTRVRLKVLSPNSLHDNAHGFSLASRPTARSIRAATGPSGSSHEGPEKKDGQRTRH